VPLGFLVLIFVLFGVDLNITTSVTLVVCLGLIVDDTIHILYRRIRLQKPLNELAIGMLKTSFILTVGFSFFLMSQSLQIQLFGVLNAIVFLIAIVSDLSIMSWLIKEHE
jgi:predicted RND superfamily exporter protein